MDCQNTGWGVGRGGREFSFFAKNRQLAVVSMWIFSYPILEAWYTVEIQKCFSFFMLLLPGPYCSKKGLGLVGSRLELCKFIMQNHAAVDQLIVRQLCPLLKRTAVDQLISCSGLQSAVVCVWVWGGWVYFRLQAELRLSFRGCPRLCPPSRGFQIGDPKQVGHHTEKKRVRATERGIIKIENSFFFVLKMVQHPSV